MTYIKQYNYFNDVELYNLGDVHRGDANCNVDLWRSILDEIEKKDNALWVSTGDLLNVALSSSKSDVYTSMSLEKETDCLCEELQNIAHKCVGIVGSNHHNRFDKAVGMSLDRLLCTRLNIPYLGKSGIINLTCDKAAYYIFMHHGVGGGRKRGSGVNRTAELAEHMYACDLYMEGHTHKYITWKDVVKYVDRKRNKITRFEATFSVTGHFLHYPKSYAADLKLAEAPQGCVKHTLRAFPVGRVCEKKIGTEFLS